DIKIPSLFPCKRVNNTQEMEKETLKSLKNANIVIMNAACSDFTPKNVSKDKIKKDKGDLTVSLKRTKDILSLIKTKRKKQLIVGFSLDTKDTLKSAEKKMKEKGVDIMVANPAITVGRENVKMIILRKGKPAQRFNEMLKSTAAEKIIDTVVSVVQKKNI
ncbi:hypothetical protein KAU34_02185, partial [candidate division WOR-3 bacterium]|nr:hypothetical protein [candidate division WOR-3 bacterium]